MAVPFTLAASPRGTQLFACPSCGASLERKSEYRVVFAGFIGAGLAGMLSLMPMWVAIPVAVVMVACLFRWTLELKVAHE
jgi:Flp pilus assembly protein TadB